jgi:hypothetical protein
MRAGQHCTGRTAMLGRRRSIPLAMLAAALLLAARVSAQVPFTSAEGGYSVSFPEKPRETAETKPEGKIFSYIVRQNDAVYGSSHVEYNSDLDIEQELQANAVNFADAVKAPVTSRRRTQFTAASGEKLPELEFSYESDKLAGKGIVIVSGRRSIMAAAFAFKPNDRRAAIDRFLQSFRLAR